MNFPMGIPHFFVGVVVVFVWVATISVFSSPTPTTTPPPTIPIVDRVEAIVRSVMRCRRLPGLSVAFVRTGKRTEESDQVFTAGYGWADANAKRNATNTTRFCLAGATQPFTAAALLKALRNNQSFTLDSPVRDVLRKFKLSDKSATLQLTLRDILAHRAGLAPFFGGLLLGYNLTRTEIVRRLRFVPAVAPFRQSALPSPLLYVLAGQLVQELSGSTWEEFVNKNFFKPNQMKGSIFADKVSRWSDDFALPHALREGQLTTLSYKVTGNVLRPVGPAASVCASSLDMAKWLQFLLHNGTNSTGSNCLHPDDINEMLNASNLHLKRGSTRGAQGKLPVESSVEAYTLGWITGTYRGYRRLFINGFANSYGAFVSLLPDLGIGIFTAANGPSLAAMDNAFRSLHYWLTDLALEKEPWLDKKSVCTFPRPWLKPITRKYKKFTTPLPLKTQTSIKLPFHTDKSTFVATESDSTLSEMTSLQTEDNTSPQVNEFLQSENASSILENIATQPSITESSSALTLSITTHHRKIPSLTTITRPTVSDFGSVSLSTKKTTLLSFETQTSHLPTPLSSTTYQSPTTASPLNQKTASVPETTFDITEETSAVPETTFEITEETSAVPETTFEITEETSAVPETTFEITEETSAVPETTFEITEETSAVPETTFDITEETTLSPELSQSSETASSVNHETSAVPETTLEITEETSAVPETTFEITEETSAVPETTFEITEETTLSPELSQSSETASSVNHETSAVPETTFEITEETTLSPKLSQSSETASSVNPETSAMPKTTLEIAQAITTLSPNMSPLSKITSKRTHKITTFRPEISYRHRTMSRLHKATSVHPETFDIHEMSTKKLRKSTTVRPTPSNAPKTIASFHKTLSPTSEAVELTKTSKKIYKATSIGSETTYLPKAASHFYKTTSPIPEISYLPRITPSPPEYSTLSFGSRISSYSSSHNKPLKNKTSTKYDTAATMFVPVSTWSRDESSSSTLNQVTQQETWSNTPLEQLVIDSTQVPASYRQNLHASAYTILDALVRAAAAALRRPTSTATTAVTVPYQPYFSSTVPWGSRLSQRKDPFRLLTRQRITKRPRIPTIRFRRAAIRRRRHTTNQFPHHVGTYNHPFFGDLTISFNRTAGTLQMDYGFYGKAHLLPKRDNVLFVLHFFSALWYMSDSDDSRRLPLRLFVVQFDGLNTDGTPDNVTIPLFEPRAPPVFKRTSS